MTDDTKLSLRSEVLACYNEMIARRPIIAEVVKHQPKIGNMLELIFAEGFISGGDSAMRKADEGMKLAIDAAFRGLLGDDE